MNNKVEKSVSATPPMGWNSWDCYGASVTEAEVLANAEYMARNMKPYGWEYVVVDIQWYESGAMSSVYRPFVPLEMDEYSRLIPADNRFPSSSCGKGFTLLAEKIHNLGLKFGIHILRGIPRQAVHANTRIFGTEIRAREIAHSSSICPWNTDMYGIDASKPGAQRYYDSLFELYAGWGVDFVKVDDMLNPYHENEIELIRGAINRCGRNMVLSLSAGPVSIDRAEHLMANANMWRISGDFWDNWDNLLQQFENCRLWSNFSGEGCWPDADMIPVGHIALRSSESGRGDRWTNFSENEQITLMTLWCICRSPLMVGCELRDCDEWTLSLLTNPEVLEVLNNSHNGRQISRSSSCVTWTADGDGCTYIALFNCGSTDTVVELPLEKFCLCAICSIRDCWKLEFIGTESDCIVTTIPYHGARLLRIT